jgi:hypothetical protein
MECSTRLRAVISSRDYGVDGQVEVPGADACLGVGEALPFVGQRAQALADQAPLVRQH